MTALKRVIIFSLILCVLGAAAPAAASEPAPLRSPEDLADKRIGVTVGSPPDFFATATFPDATILRFPTIADALTALKAGRIDAVIAARPPLVDARDRDDTLVFLAENLYPQPVGNAFQKGDAEMTATFNAFLRMIQEDGTLDDLLRRYFEELSYTMPEIPGDSRNGQLLFGTTSLLGVPFATIERGENVGLEIELAKRFAAYIGKELVIREIDYSGLLAALATGKVEMVGGNLAITEERQKTVDFSDTVYYAYSSILTTRDKVEAGVAEMESAGFFAKLKDSFYRNIILEQRYLLIVKGLGVTVSLAVLAIAFGTALGAAVCAARMSERAPIRMAAKIYIAFLRGVPVLVVLMLLYYVAFASIHINPFLAAILAFGMTFAASSAELFRAGIESVDRGQREAGVISGFAPRQIFRYIVQPQAARRILPVWKGEVISLVKMTSVVGYIAVEDLTKAGDIIRSRTMEAFFPLIMVAALYFLISWLLASLLSHIERRVDPKNERERRGGS